MSARRRNSHRRRALVCHSNAASRRPFRGRGGAAASRYWRVHVERQTPRWDSCHIPRALHRLPYVARRGQTACCDAIFKFSKLSASQYFMRHLSSSMYSSRSRRPAIRRDTISNLQSRRLKNPGKPRRAGRRSFAAMPDKTKYQRIKFFERRFSSYIFGKRHTSSRMMLILVYLIHCR